MDVHNDDERPEASVTEAEAEAAAQVHHRRLSVWQESLILLAAALVLSFIVKTFFVQAFYIPSGSMEPGMEVDDRILVQKVSYWGDGGPQRGDAVVFEDPGGWLAGSASEEPGGVVATVLSKIGLYPTGGHLVKRVIGVEGDVIRCCDDEGRLLINGVPLDSSGFTRNEEDCDGPMPTQDCSWRTGPVPAGHVFVMGDHRDASADSSVHLCRDDVETDCVPGEEFVPVDLVVGKAFSRVWPADRIKLLQRPSAFDDLAEALGEK